MKRSRDKGSRKGNEMRSKFCEAQIRVGDKYQAGDLPVCASKVGGALEEYEEKATLAWSPCTLDDSLLDNYEQVAVHMYGYSIEQALARLFFHDYNHSRAMRDLAKLTPTSCGWSDCDKRRFEEAFKIEGKNFELIHRKLPDKTIKSIVEHYFSRERAAMQNLFNLNVDSVRNRKKLHVLKPLPSIMKRRNSKLKVLKYRKRKLPQAPRNPNRTVHVPEAARTAVRNVSIVDNQLTLPLFRPA